MSDNLNIDPHEVRNLAAQLDATADTPIDPQFLPGESMLGVGSFIRAFNAAVDNVSLRARLQCIYVDDAVTKTLAYVRLVEEQDAALVRALDHTDD
ncbi:MAG: hypothetical protein Q4A82_00555 [Corynebacterium sp.]|nr:hypothetical protein [Corynebacterium sp.]